jgi:L-iditol 2-dehydrogenase
MVGITGGRLDMFVHHDFGTWQVFNNDTQDVLSKVLALTGGRGADAAIVAAPVKSVQAQAVNVVRKRGRVGLFGGLPKDDPITALDSNRIHYNEICIMGNFSYHPRMHAVALDVLSRGLIEADKIITAPYPLERVMDAFTAAMNAAELKVVLTPHSTD